MKGAQFGIQGKQYGDRGGSYGYLSSTTRCGPPKKQRESFNVFEKLHCIAYARKWRVTIQSYKKKRKQYKKYTKMDQLRNH